MKLQDKILNLVFCIFIFAFGILFTVIPKETFSENEKRELAKAPSFSAEAVLNGKFETAFESYLNDHFPFRRNFTALNSYYLLYTGRNGENGIYKGKDGYLFTKPSKAGNALQENITALKNFAADTKIMSTMILIPSSGFVMSDKLPTVHEEYNDDKILSSINKETESEIRWVDILSKYESSKDSGQIYFKTDHHYTAYGAFLAYEAFCEEHGLTPYKDYSIETYSGFYGTSYSKSALWSESGEDFEVWRYPSNTSVEIDGTTYNSLWFDEHLNKLDKYPVFLNGNQPFERITNPDAEGGNILILKDSYAHALVPFLAQHYKTIDMVDLRYYFNSVGDLVKENNYGEIFMIYGLSSLCDSNDISILGV